MFKALLIALATVGLAGCQTAKNTLSLDDIASLRLAGVDVSFAPDSGVSWGDGERAFAASKGRPATESDNLAKTPEGQAYVRNIIAGKVKTAMERKLSGELVGLRPVRVRVTVKGVVVVSAIQRVLIGGYHWMAADVTLVDAKTGATMLPYEGQVRQAPTGQGVGGVLVEAALMGDAIDRVVDNYAAHYGYWLMRKEPPDFAGSSSG